MEDFIKQYLFKYNMVALGKISDDDLKIIYDLYHNDIICEPYNLPFNKYDNDNKLSNTILRYYGHYYRTKKKDVGTMIKYYLAAIELGDSTAMISLGGYYAVEKNYDDMLKYYLLGLQKCNKIDREIIQTNFNKKFKNDDTNSIADKLVQMTIDAQIKNSILEEKINILEEKNTLLTQENIHLKYIPGGIGYLEAKQDFESNAKN